MSDEIKETVIVGEGAPAVADGTALQSTQMPGEATTVSAGAAATGGIAPGHLFETEIDEDLFMFHQDETPLTQMSLLAKRVPVQSPVVQHFQIDEERSTVTVTSAVSGSGHPESAALPLGSSDRKLVKEYDTLLVSGVSGYAENGTTEDGELMLYVTGKTTEEGYPVVRSVNGPIYSDAMYVPDIPEGAEVRILCNAASETQKVVPPSSSKPVPSLVYCQKSVMNRVVSDYFASQRKRIKFTDALLAEKDIMDFKRKRNRTLWAGRKGKTRTYNQETKQYEDVYFSEGVRWQFKKEYMVPTGQRWTFERFIALAKMFYTGEDVPQTAIFLVGKDLLESIQNIDFSKHPEVTITVVTNKMGWSVTNIHTVFGDFQLRREATLDILGWSNCGAIFGENRLVRYDRSSEHSFNEEVKDAEAKREGVILWDGVALKGSCHIFVNGNGGPVNASANIFTTWDSGETPTASDLTDGGFYYFTQATTLVAAVEDDDSTSDTDESQPAVVANQGEIWKVTIDSSDSSLTWEKQTGRFVAS